MSIRKCGGVRLIDGELVACGGIIEDILIEEDGKTVVHEICNKCGRDDSLEPMVLKPDGGLPVRHPGDSLVYHIG